MPTRLADPVIPTGGEPVVITEDTTIADIDEALSHLRERWAMGTATVRTILGPRIDQLLDARQRMTTAASR
jgi:hypothetical protein